MRGGDEISVFVPNPTYLKHTTLILNQVAETLTMTFTSICWMKMFEFRRADAKIDLIKLSDAISSH